MRGRSDLLLGIDFGGTKMAIALAEASGRIIERITLPTLAEQGAQQALDRVLQAAQELINSVGLPRSAGIATPGVITGDGIQLAPNVPGWSDLRLGTAVREQLSIEDVQVANDLNAAALAELHWGQLRDCDPGLVVGLGTGVALAVTVGDQVVPGAHGAAGEIAYAPIGSGAFDGADPILEEVVSGVALDELARLEGLAGAAELTASTTAAHRALVAERLGVLVRKLITVCLALDPQRVVLVGGMTSGVAVVKAVTHHLTRHVPIPPEVVVSAFPRESALLGAVQLAARQLPQPAVAW